MNKDTHNTEEYQLHLPTCSTARGEEKGGDRVLCQSHCPSQHPMVEYYLGLRGAYRKEQKVPTSASSGLLHKCQAVFTWTDRGAEGKETALQEQDGLSDNAYAMDQPLHSATSTAPAFT